MPFVPSFQMHNIPVFPITPIDHIGSDGEAWESYPEASVASRPGGFQEPLRCLQSWLVGRIAVSCKGKWLREVSAGIPLGHTADG